MKNTLRQATRNDIAGIFKVRYAVSENRLPAGILDDEDVRREIEDTGRGWVIEADGNILAFAIGNKESGNIWALFVAPEAEGNGYGRRLHDHMLAWLWSQELQKLWLTTGPGTRAQYFYEMLGWQKIKLTEKGEIQFEMDRSSIK
ncbi:MAG: GNAT family N-acetyltransferase [Arenimonas sp.]